MSEVKRDFDFEYHRYSEKLLQNELRSIGDRAKNLKEKIPPNFDERITGLRMQLLNCFKKKPDISSRLLETTGAIHAIPLCEQKEFYQKIGLKEG